MAGELFINGKDAFNEWGVILESSGLSSLMTPPPMKDYIETKFRTQHGKTIVNKTPRLEEKDVIIAGQMFAADKADFFTKWSGLCSELAKGYLEITSKYLPGVVFKCYYVSCTQFSEFIAECASFSLKLVEPNPTDRSSNG